MPDAGEEHRDAQFVGFGDGFLVADGAARLDDGCDAIFSRQGDRVAERQEAVGSQHQTGRKAGSLIPRRNSMRAMR